MTLYRQSISKGLGAHGNSTLLAVDLSTVSAQNGIRSNKGQRRFIQGGNNGLMGAHYTNSTEQYFMDPVSNSMKRANST